MRSALLSLVLALPLPLYAALAAGPAQDPSPGATQEPATGDRGPGAAQEEPDEEEAADLYGKQARPGGRGRLEGCWKLTEVQMEGFPARGRKDTGALLVHDGYLAFELHMAWAGGVNRPALQQSFIAEYELVRDRELHVKALIGSTIDQNIGDFDWQKNGFARDFGFTVTGNRLVLTFGQGNVLTYVRQRSKASLRRDIFGRQQTEAAAERDIFGRPSKPAAEAEGTGGAPGGESKRDDGDPD